MQAIKNLWSTTIGKIAIILGSIIFFCVACLIFSSLLPQQQQQPVISQESIMQTAEADVWKFFTQTALAIPTNTFTPQVTQTPSLTPEPTFTFTATVPPLFEPKTNGFYLINTNIAPGVWKSDGSSGSCYWAVTSATGDILSNHFGMAGGTAYVDPTGFQVEFNGCGTWTFIQAP